MFFCEIGYWPLSIPVEGEWSLLIFGVALFDFSGGHEMKDKSSGDACRNGNDSAPQPIRKNAKAKYHQASQ